MTGRVGIGYDAHRFQAGRPLVLGGVPFPGEVGLVGHSDADVVLHALTDALLGAAGLGDIGAHFPPADPANSGRSSIEFVRETCVLLARASYAPRNVDITIIAEKPRLAPHTGEMRERIAAALGVTLDAVSVKASTNDRMGSIGAGEGIAAIAVALLEPGD